MAERMSVAQTETRMERPIDLDLSRSPRALRLISGNAAQFVNVPVDTFIAHFWMFAQKLIG